MDDMIIFILLVLAGICGFWRESYFKRKLEEKDRRIELLEGMNEQKDRQLTELYTEEVEELIAEQELIDKKENEG